MAVPKDLHQQLAQWRSFLEPIWNQETAYPLTITQAGSPLGQCAVTSLLLLQHLDAIQSLKPKLILGQVLSSHTIECLIPSHGWLTLEATTPPTILDITADQSPAIPHKIILTQNPESELGLTYSTKKELTLDKAKSQEIWARYQLLLSKALPHISQ